DLAGNLGQDAVFAGHGIRVGAQRGGVHHAAATGSAPVTELKFGAAQAIDVLFAFQNKIRIEQINDSDTIEELTNGVSSRRNQLLMDMSAELGVPAIDGAADADVATLRTKVNTAAPGYSPFGAVLGEAITARLRALFGAAGLKPAAVGERVTGTWSLPASWTPHVEAEILLGTREEDSVRGGSLNTIPSAAGNKQAAHDLIDAAVQSVANAHGQSVSMGGAAAAGGGGVVDSAALSAYADSVTGEDGVLAKVARQILGELGLNQPAADTGADADTALFDAVEAELGAGWLKSVTPSFDPKRAVLFDDRWASAREDLTRVALGEVELDVERFRGTGETIAKQATWWAANGGQGDLEAIAQAAREEWAGEYAKDTALVTGAAPGSIATALVEKLLQGGATVIMTASNVSQARKEFARKLYAANAAPGAALWIVPANLSSFRDVDALIAWIGAEQRETVGNEVKILKPALTPTLAFPFAAPGVSGSLADAGGNTETQARLLLWSVERTIAGLSELAQKAVDTRCHVVLPGSPNRGTFGGDGAYGEVKAALDAIINKWHVEAGWPKGITLAQAKIGWVAGTHLMGGNDMLVPVAKKAGIHVWSPAEISSELMALASADARAQAADAPLDKDLTGGLEGVSLSALAADLPAPETAEEAEGPETIAALPSPKRPVQPGADAFGGEIGEVTKDLEDMVVIAGVGEVSSWGSGRTRFEAEYGLQRDGSVELTAAGVIELAWMTGLIEWREEPNAAWYVTETDEVIEEEDIYDRFRDEVVARAGVRTLTDKYNMTDQGSIDLTTVFLDRDVEFTVASEAEARDIKLADPDFTTIGEQDGEWLITRHKGATVKVPRKATLTRTVAAQMPDDFDATKWGVPEHMVDALDRMAVWNLVTAIDAFITAGFSPAELLRAIHPTQVATTQGTGIGGMESLHKVFVTRFLGEERPSDILQEALPNVIAAHTMQSLVGGYGSMIHPIGACATAAVSIEEGVDKIALGKADVVVAGGIDDVQVESLTGFGDMNATAETAAMTAQGISERFISRANDRRRGGFLEGEGGGTVLLVRGSLAAELGLPVLAVVAHAASHGDGAHTSIPAPGLGALAAGRGRENSRLARGLKSLGLSPDDVTVLSKHDTSTNANDPNESELHSILWPAIGRNEDKPMFVISQKTLTGHAKAGAALFQTGGIIDVFRTGRIPANVSLDVVDPLIEPKAKNLVWLREPLDVSARGVKAAVLTSLGFGHVGAIIVYAHPGVFEQAVTQQRGADAAATWRSKAESRLAAGHDRFEAGMLGRAPLFEVIDGRRLPAKNAKAAEIAMLLDEDARLGEDGTYPSA
ncbi:beta-ketoacyl synthase N-terminal-like domain-containing protein, partial [Corynebacterium phocae]|uniref:beta-ketoacyl synthase N-terminal-like domain-containing protein n=1 Tax=Corynebacterium phocae TaxID=161895 RepID=UPI00127EE940